MGSHFWFVVSFLMPRVLAGVDKGSRGGAEARRFLALLLFRRADGRSASIIFGLAEKHCGLSLALLAARLRYSKGGSG